MLGKRKREVAVAIAPMHGSQKDEQLSTAPSTTGRDIFRKYFEATFEPLPPSQPEAPSLLEDEEEAELSEDESEWQGISDTEQEKATVEIIHHRAVEDAGEHTELQRQRYKSFMSSRPPRETEPAAMKKVAKQADDEDASEALNLKHDLDLQRLLKESHLLAQARASSMPGSHRHRAVDMRMQSLGSKGSMFHQDKMPLAHRRGILAKAASREATRRKEAQENGIILEKASGKSRSNGARRERGVDVPAVGKFRGGTLKLSKKDVFEIQGTGRPGGRGKQRTR